MRMLCFAVLASLFSPVTSFAQKTTALKCGSLLDTRTGQVLTQQTILIKNGRIEQVTDKPVQADTLIDLSGYFVLPGLIDCHTHVLLQGDVTSDDYAVQLLKESIPYRTLRASRSAAIALGNGFTTIRDLETEGAMYADVDIKKAINNHVIAGPRMQVATRAINTVGHYALSPKEYNWELDLPKGIQEINGADEARRAVREQVAHGADWIKIYADRGYYRQPDGVYHSLPNFTKEEITAVGDETARSHKKLAAHAVTRDGVLDAIRAGAVSIEHGFGMDDECLQLMAKQHVYWCPTIYICDYVADGRAKEGQPINKYFMETFPALFKKAMAAGVTIAYGTDIGGYSWDAPQAKDFEYMVQWGMSPVKAIQTATITAAQLLDMPGQIGEIKAGAWADIIAVKGNPLQNISLLQQVSWVMKEGEVYKK
ncbi:amidohydrolase family protein [Deminuibacter soli]|uniref:Amidohydrolase family protein n=1 Tax=Deminuibacter soli TaxID=2291815 RepID=A0A3E1NPI1_9BACT|nr:amidohydrolase family protein [Deminuibacter soli]RFM29849.1 amidohydrolase family protein [Deminuibacter soli]